MLKFLSWIENYAKNARKEYFLKRFGSDSCCPRCKQWESDGNVIRTEPSNPDDGSDIRTCINCKYEWRTIFTPFGHVPVDEEV